MSEFQRVFAESMESQLSSSMPSVSLENISQSKIPDNKSSSDDQNVDTLVSQVAMNLLKMIIELKDEIEEESSEEQYEGEELSYQDHVTDDELCKSITPEPPYVSNRSQDHYKHENTSQFQNRSNTHTDSTQIQELDIPQYIQRKNLEPNEIQQLIDNEIQLMKLKQLHEIKQLQSNIQNTSSTQLNSISNSNLQLQSVSQPKSQMTPSLIFSNDLSQKLANRHSEELKKDQEQLKNSKQVQESQVKVDKDITIRSTVLQSAKDEQFNQSQLQNDDDEIVKMICSVSNISNHDEIDTRAVSPLKMKMSQYIENKKQDTQLNSLASTIQDDESNQNNGHEQHSDSLALSKSITKQQIRENNSLNQSIQKLLDQDTTVEKLQKELLLQQKQILKLQTTQEQAQIINQENSNLVENNISSSKNQLTSYAPDQSQVPDLQIQNEFIYAKLNLKNQDHEDVSPITSPIVEIPNQVVSSDSVDSILVNNINTFKKEKMITKQIVKTPPQNRSSNDNKLDLNLLNSYSPQQKHLQLSQSGGQKNVSKSQVMKSPQRIVRQKQQQQYANQEKYSQKIYQLNQNLVEKDQIVTDLQVKCNQLKTFTTSERQTNIEMRKRLKLEQQKRLDLQNEILMLKQSQDFKIQKAKNLNLNLNKKLIQELTYIKNDNKRNNTQFQDQQNYLPTYEESYIANLEVVQPPKNKKPVPTDISQFQSNNSNLELKQIQTNHNLKTPSPQKQQQIQKQDSLFEGLATSKIDSLVNDLFVKTINENTRQLLSPQQISQVKLGLKEQIMDVIKKQQQQPTQELIFSPLQQQQFQQITPPKKVVTIQQKSPSKVIDSLQSTITQNQIQEPIEISSEQPLNSSNISLPMTLNDPYINSLRQEIKQTPMITTQTSQLPPYLSVNNNIYASIPPKNNQKVTSNTSSTSTLEVSTFSHLSKVRKLKIKRTGEASILFLIDIDETNQNDTIIQLFDLIKELTGQINSIHEFIPQDSQIIQTAIKLISSNASDALALKLKASALIGIFCAFSDLPEPLKPLSINLIQQLKSQSTFSINSKVLSANLDLILAVSQLIYLSNSGLSQSKITSKVNEIHRNIIQSLQNLSSVIGKHDFRPFSNPTILTILSVIKKLQSENLLKIDLANEFGACVCQYSVQVNKYMKTIENELLSYQTVGVGCIFGILIVFGQIDMDKETQNIVFEQSQQCIKNCKGISQIPGFSELMK